MIEQYSIDSENPFVRAKAAARLSLLLGQNAFLSLYQNPEGAAVALGDLAQRALGISAATDGLFVDGRLDEAATTEPLAAWKRTLAAHAEAHGAGLDKDVPERYRAAITACADRYQPTDEDRSLQINGYHGAVGALFAYVSWQYTELAKAAGLSA